jgi:hypothetical protein
VVALAHLPLVQVDQVVERKDLLIQLLEDQELLVKVTLADQL